MISDGSAGCFWLGPSKNQRICSWSRATRELPEGLWQAEGFVLSLFS